MPLLNFLRRASALVVGIGLASCANVSSYSTPRTIPAGEGQGTLALEGEAVAGSGRGAAVYPTGATYIYRYGVADRTDVGFRVGNFTALGIDAKENFLRGRIDLAVDPSAQWYGGLSADLDVPRFLFDIPLIAAYNFSESTSLVVSPGVSFLTGWGDPGSNTMPRALQSTQRGVYGRLGIGVNFRVLSAWALQPEVTAMREVAGGDAFILTGGLGITYGYLPSYEDLSASGPAADSGNSSGEQQ